MVLNSLHDRHHLLHIFYVPGNPLRPLYTLICLIFLTQVLLYLSFQNYSLLHSSVTKIVKSGVEFELIHPAATILTSTLNPLLCAYVLPFTFVISFDPRK